MSILIVLTYIFLLLVAVEIILRVTKSVPLFCKIDLFSFGAEYELSSNPKLIYIPKSNSGEFNTYGHRGKAFSFKKIDKKRIVVMGDSVVEGFGVDVKERFTEKLGKKLGSKYEVINLGVRGYNVLQESEYFKLLGVKFSPDIVLWGITYNDLVLHSGEVCKLNKLMQRMENSHFYKEYYRAKSELEKILLCFYLYRHIRYYLAIYYKKSFEETVYYEIDSKEASNLLKQLKALSQKNNFRLMFIFLPVNTTEYADKINNLEALIKSEGVSYLNLNSYFDSEDRKNDKKYLFFSKDPCHFNTLGHQFVADMLYKNVL